MGYTLPQIAVILAKADRTMYKIGSVAYNDMFNELDESLDYNRDIIYIYKVAVEYADNFYVGTDKLDAVVERLGAKIAVYDFGQLTPIYSNATIVTQSVPVGAALDDLSDVTITNVQNNQTLRYSSSLGQWINIGPGAAVRNRQQFTATLNQTVFVTTFPFESGLLDVYLNGVKLSPPSYTTFGNYTITLADGSLVDDIVEVIAYDPATSFIDLSGYVPTSRTLTINGVTYDLSANRSWTVTAGLSSVGLSMPSAFTVSNNPLTANGTISVIGAGTTAQYIRGDGSLATFPALTGYIPYTGATDNVDLGEFGIRAGQFTLDTSPTGTAAVGTTRWNDALGSSETTLKGGSVILKNGVDLVARIVNKVTPNATLTKAAYQVVRVSGAQGQRLAVAYAQANNDNNSADTLGLVIETIPTNQEGFIITMGQIENINTTGSLQGETWVDGDVLYLSPTTPGAITKVKPTGNGHIVVIGYVEYAHVNNGKIYVKVMNGWELDELHDVDIVSPANNEALIYESSTSLWKNKTIATALGYTPISGSGVAGQVAYWNGTNSQTGSNNLFWDAANNRLGIGLTNPLYGLDVSSSVRFSNGTAMSTGYSFGVQRLQFNNGVAGGNIGVIKGISDGIIVLSNAAENNFTRLVFGSTTTSFPALQRTGVSLCVVDAGSGTLSNLIVGSFTDGGQRLQVYGDAFIKGSGSTSATTGLAVQNSNGTALFTVRNDGNIGVNTASPGQALDVSGNIRTSSNFLVSNGGQLYSSGEFSLRYDRTSNSTTNGFITLRNNNATLTAASGSQIEFGIGLTSFAPTSGTATYITQQIVPTINQTGGANGITRGLYVNPTLTAAADWRSIEWSNNTGWGLYGAGTANNYLGGKLLLNSNSDNGNYSLQVNGGGSIYGSGNLLLVKSTGQYLLMGEGTGNNQYGILNWDATNNMLQISTQPFEFGTSGGQINLPLSGNILLGTTTDAGFKLDVNGTARVSGAATFSSSVTAIKALIGDNGFGSQWAVFNHADSTGASNAFVGIDNSNGSQISNIKTNGTFEWRVSNSNVMNLKTSGNLLVGTTTDAGYRLDVQGTARVSDTVSITSNTSTSYALNIIGRTTAGNASTINFFNNAASTRYGFVYVDSSSFEIGSITGSNIPLVFSTNQSERMRLTSGGNLLVGTTTDIASSKVTISSTTQGFLPPRMTNAQRTAISSPAVGLIVYCTDATEGLYQYINNAWVNLTGVVTNRQTASYTLALGDSNDLVEMNVATANNLTVPLNSSVTFPIGTKIDIAQYGAGQTSVVATGGVTIRSAGGALKLAVQYSGATLVKIATDEWYLFGDITV